jgi:transposase
VTTCTAHQEIRLPNENSYDKFPFRLFQRSGSVPSPDKRNSMAMRDEFTDQQVAELQRLNRQKLTVAEIKARMELSISEETIRNQMKKLGITPNNPRSTYQHTSHCGQEQAHLLKS